MEGNKTEYAIEVIITSEGYQFRGPTRPIEEVDRPIREVEEDTIFYLMPEMSKVTVRENQPCPMFNRLLVPKGTELGLAEGGFRLWTRESSFGPKIWFLVKYPLKK